MSLWKFTAIALLVIVAVAPGVTRAYQVLDSRPSASLRDMDLPPDPDELPADLAVASSLEITAVLQPLDGFIEPLVLSLPSSPLRSDGDALRAPPALFA